MGTIPRLGSDNKPKTQNFLKFHGQSPKSCLICQDECSNVQSCKVFTELSVPDRWNEVKSKHLCRSCLKLHNGRCRGNIRCSYSNCTSRHNSLLHRVIESQQHQTTGSSQSMNTHDHKSSRTLFKYVPIILYGKRTAISTYAFRDDGSSVTVWIKA